MGTYTEIQLSEFDELLKASKGWVRNVSGKEYVYDYKMKKFPLMMKVLSSITEGETSTRVVGKDSIKVFVVRLDANGKITRGYSKAIRVNRTMNWRENVKNAFIKQQKCIYARERR